MWIRKDKKKPEAVWPVSPVDRSASGLRSPSASCAIGMEYYCF